MKEPSSGVVSTPPKSETTTSISVIGVHYLVVPEPLTTLDCPAEESDLGTQARPLHRGGADQGPGAAKRLSVLAVGPKLKRCPALHPVRSVLGREQCLGDLDRSAVGTAHDRRYLLLTVSAGARRSHCSQSQ